MSDQSDLAGELACRALWNQCEPIDVAMAVWLMLPWYRRLWEWIWG